MYSISDYGAMISDGVRMDAFVRALRGAVKPGAIVIDIGTGTGIFALLACRFGARRVYAIEPEDAIEVAREIAAANGCADRIEFIQAMSTRVTLPESGRRHRLGYGDMLPWFPATYPVESLPRHGRFSLARWRIDPRTGRGMGRRCRSARTVSKGSRWDANGFDLDMGRGPPDRPSTPVTTAASRRATCH